MLVKAELSSSSEITIVPYEKAYTAGFEDLQVRVPNLSRVRAAIDFKPEIGLEETIRDIAMTMTSNEVAP